LRFRPGSKQNKLANVASGSRGENRSAFDNAYPRFDFAKLRVEVAVMVRT
jgi:hypothetical protein